MPGSRVYEICSDVIPISAWKKAQAKVLACKTQPKPWYKPWHKPKPQCSKMSTFSDQVEARETTDEVVEETEEKETEDEE